MYNCFFVLLHLRGCIIEGLRLRHKRPLTPLLGILGQEIGVFLGKSEAGAGAAEYEAHHHHRQQHSGYLEGGRLDDGLGPQVRGEERVRALQSVVGRLGIKWLAKV